MFNRIMALLDRSPLIFKSISISGVNYNLFVVVHAELNESKLPVQEVNSKFKTSLLGRFEPLLIAIEDSQSILNIQRR